MKKIDIENNINKYYIIVSSICIALVMILLLFSIRENTKQYLVQTGKLEHTEITTGYIIRKEAIISKDQSKVLVPVIAEGARISKDDIIATYKGAEYKNYEETLSQKDKEILERMQDLPIVYSSEVDAIDDIIYTLVKESIGVTSYNKMQEYKQKINTNINKRANIIGELSPAGAEIKKLIEERNEYEAQAKQSNDNILSPIPGIVSYTVDGLESKLNYDNINELDYTTIKEKVNENKKTDNTKIKVVDNYEAYIVMKASLENLDYINVGSDYTLRLIEQSNYEFTSTLDKVKQVEDGIEVYFKVTNGIENIINLRETEIEIVWDYSKGLIIPSTALNKYENIDAYYVEAIKYTDYKKIPISVKIENENYVVVQNFTDEELMELELESEYTLKLYDRIIVRTKK